MIHPLYTKSMILLVTITMKYWKWQRKNLTFLMLFMAMMHPLSYGMAVMCTSECYTFLELLLVKLIRQIFLIT
ncbi:hypothetical protein DSJ_24865 (plasmid) [Pantoea stewartii subsp. stewartii DC283]|uniref:Uncharacterized protein n=1 Tax=Pantoea stewartii subsp. stewartii DC283 TaxID=660596 RepID=A0ABN4ZC25_PANSE|nr:hypothetical protein DSJ_24865 [Pantoea stewartii subsp. stewartii DC283]